jgi:hypothetical protein
VRLEVGGGKFTGCVYKWAEDNLLGAPATVCGYNRVRLLLRAVITGCVLQLGAVTTGCGYSWVKLQLVAATAG